MPCCVGDNVSFALGLGVGAERIDDLSVQMVASAVGQNKFIGTEVDDGAAVETIAGGGVHDPAVQLRTAGTTTLPLRMMSWVTVPLKGVFGVVESASISCSMRTLKTVPSGNAFAGPGT